MTTTLGCVRSPSSLLLTSLTIHRHFSGWNPDAEAGTDAYYSRQMYTGGQKCWNGVRPLLH